MAKQYTAKIPFSRVEKIGIICNQNKRATLSTIYSELQSKYPNKEIYLSNCGFFNMTTNWTACFGLKADGVEWGYNWTMPYIGIKNNKKMEFCQAGTSVKDYTDAISGFPVLVENGQKSPSFSYCVDNSDRGRTMLGFNDKEVVLSVIADTSGSTDFTLDEEVSYMKNQGCTYAINLDGGGSSQCNFNGNKINSSRKVHNLFYIIAIKDTSSTSTPTSSSAPVDISKLSIGQVIKLKTGAKYASGLSIPKWVINSVLYVRGFNNSGVIFSTLKSGAITGVVPTQYIEGAMTDAPTSTNTTTNNTTNTTNTNTITNNSTSNTTTSGSTRTFTVGQVIQLKAGAKYTSGLSIPNWVINTKVLYVRSITNYGIVFSTLKTGDITGIVSPDYIK